MYILPLIAILLIALAIFLSPILAVILFVVFLIGLGAYKFLARGTEPEHAPPPDQPARTAGSASSADTGERNSTRTGPGEEKTGQLGEARPEQWR